MKSPLRYPGGKTRAVKLLLDKYIPADVKVCSPFIGGGSVELALCERGQIVYGYDLFKPLVAFWKQLQNNSENLYTEVTKYFPITKDEFYQLQRSDFNCELQLATQFYVLNRASFSGSSFSGGMSPQHPRFTEKGIELLNSFYEPNLIVDCLSFDESILRHGTEFLFCDPPYAISQGLYGKNGDLQKGFNHEKLSDLLKKRNRWVLCYNNCDYIKKLYEGYTIVEASWAYGMNKSKESSEIIIIGDGNV